MYYYVGCIWPSVNKMQEKLTDGAVFEAERTLSGTVSHNIRPKPD